MKEIDYTSLARRAVLRGYAEDASQGPWHPGCLVNDDTPCNCPWVTSPDYCGSICTVDIDNELPIEEGGNDSPPLEKAKANLRFIAANHPDQQLALLDYILELEAKLEELGVKL